MSVKNWPTKKILEIMNNPHGCSEIGTDFEELLPELTEEYYRRMNKKDEENNNRMVEQYNREA